MRELAIRLQSQMQEKDGPEINWVGSLLLYSNTAALLYSASSFSFFFRSRFYFFIPNPFSIKPK